MLKIVISKVAACDWDSVMNKYESLMKSESHPSSPEIYIYMSGIVSKYESAVVSGCQIRSAKYFSSKV